MSEQVVEIHRFYVDEFGRFEQLRGGDTNGFDDFAGRVVLILDGDKVNNLEKIRRFLYILSPPHPLGHLNPCASPWASISGDQGKVSTFSLMKVPQPMQPTFSRSRHRPKACPSFVTLRFQSSRMQGIPYLGSRPSID